MAAAFAYVTAPNRDVALQISSALLEQRLIACANVIDGMTSLYRWEGEIRQDSEVVVIFKTRQDLVTPLVESVRRLHPYACPCVVSWPIPSGHSEYLDWIESETATAAC